MGVALIEYRQYVLEKSCESIIMTSNFTVNKRISLYVRQSDNLHSLIPGRRKYIEIIFKSYF